MVKAVWKGRVIAETDSPQMVEGNVYYPPDSLKKEFFGTIDKTTVCGWKVRAAAGAHSCGAARCSARCLRASSAAGRRQSGR
jgi:uncharacterized protein (DUF427 family)